MKIKQFTEYDINNLFNVQEVTQMDSKKCGMCELFLPLTAFNKNSSNNDGLLYMCKTCLLAYRRSHDIKLHRIYYAQRTSSRRRGHPPPDYTLNEWCEWALCNGYTELHTAWVNSGHTKALAPSGDRLDNDLPYTLDNLELTTWKINNKRGWDDNKRPVTIRRLDGTLVCEYPSVTAAADALDVPLSNISDCCAGRVNSVGGYIAHYTDTSYVHDPTVPRNTKVPKKVGQYKDTVLVKFYDSVGAASRATGIAQSSISTCCSGHRKTAGGFTWCFI
jgi:hypothetical protein